jgi:putative hydrolase of the HAD superfamily
MKEKKIVFFDIYKTLIDIKTDEEDIRAYEFVCDWLGYKGIRINAREFYSVYRETIAKEVEPNRETYPDIDIGRVFKKIVKDEAVAKETALLFRIHTTRFISLFPDTKAVLEALYGKARLVLVSNSQRLFTMPELIKFDLVRYFENIVLSSDVGSCKPGKKIFNAALKAAGTRPENVVYVGDNLFDDIWGAKKVGMKAVWINHGVRNVLPQGFELEEPDAEVNPGSYKDLPEIILKQV